MGHIIERIRKAAPDSRSPLRNIVSGRLTIILEALPLVTFGGLLMGIGYLHGYLEATGVPVSQVAGISDYLTAVLYGLAILASLVVVGALAFAGSARMKLKRRIATLSISCIFLLISYSFAFFPVSVSSYLPNITILGRDIFLGFAYIDWRQQFSEADLSILLLALTAAALGVGLAALEWRIRSNWKTASVIGVVVAAGLGYASQVVGERDFLAGRARQFVVVDKGVTIPLQYAVGDEVLPDQCKCGADLVWAGERSTVYDCSGRIISVHGAQNIVLTTSPYWAKTLAAGYAFDAMRSCKIARRATEASLREIGWTKAPDGSVSGTVQEKDGDGKLGFNCANGILYLSDSGSGLLALVGPDDMPPGLVVTEAPLMPMQSRPSKPGVTKLAVPDGSRAGEAYPVPFGSAVYWSDPPVDGKAAKDLLIAGHRFDLSPVFAELVKGKCV